MSGCELNKIQGEIMLDNQSAKEIEDILRRRANEVAFFLSDYQKDSKHHGSVEMALSREIERLRELADKVSPVEEDDNHG